MKSIKKAIMILSWIILAVEGTLLFAYWHRINSSVVVLNEYSVMYTSGSKTSLFLLLVIAIALTLLFTLDYDFPFVKQIRNWKPKSLAIEPLNVILQLVSLVVASSFIVVALMGMQ